MRRRGRSSGDAAHFCQQCGWRSEMKEIELAGGEQRQDDRHSRQEYRLLE
ncbi:hypothetical protein IAI13_38160, partial [Escherichia coli]|nr:hypothetical protein [Escherichia coli]